MSEVMVIGSTTQHYWALLTDGLSLDQFQAAHLLAARRPQVVDHTQHQTLTLLGTESDGQQVRRVSRSASQRVNRSATRHSRQQISILPGLTEHMSAEISVQPKTACPAKRCFRALG